MSVLLLIHAFATLFMTGLIWFVQVVHYPLFASVGREQFPAYEDAHQRLTTWVVCPTMLVELGSGIWLLKTGSPETIGLIWTGAALIIVIWLITAGLSVPAHRQLAQGYSDSAHRRLVLTNWIRTVAWSLRSALVLVIIHRLYLAEVF